jgi:NAD-dependent DNA ligase
MENMDNQKHNLYNKIICLSGFDSEKEIIKQLLSKKYNVSFTNITTQKTDFLIVKEPDKPYPSSKIKMAMKYNIPIIDYTEIIN